MLELVILMITWIPQQIPFWVLVLQFSFELIKTFFICTFTMCTTQRSSRSQMFCKIGVCKNFAKFTEKHLCQSLFCDEVVGIAWSTTLLLKTLQHRCFPVNFPKFLRALFLQNTSRRLLLFLYIFSWGIQEYSKTLKKSLYEYKTPSEILSIQILVFQSFKK